MKSAPETERQALVGRFKAALEAMRAVLDEIDERPLPEPEEADDLFVVLWALTHDGDLAALSDHIAEIEHRFEEIGL